MYKLPFWNLVDHKTVKISVVAVTEMDFHWKKTKKAVITVPSIERVRPQSIFSSPPRQKSFPKID